MQEEKWMTIYHGKISGEIIKWCTGQQNMSIFGAAQQDYEAGFTYAVVPIDNDVLKTPYNFAINAATKEVEQKEEAVSKYKIKAKKKK